MRQLACKTYQATSLQGGLRPHLSRSGEWKDPCQGGLSRSRGQAKGHFQWPACVTSVSSSGPSLLPPGLVHPRCALEPAWASIRPGRSKGETADPTERATSAFPKRRQPARLMGGGGGSGSRQAEARLLGRKRVCFRADYKARWSNRVQRPPIMPTKSQDSEQQKHQDDLLSFFS